MYQRVSKGRESLNLAHASALTRVSMQGTPVASADSAELRKAALEHFLFFLVRDSIPYFDLKEKLQLR